MIVIYQESDVVGDRTVKSATKDFKKMAELVAIKLKMNKVYLTAQEIAATFDALETKDFRIAIEKYGYYGGYIGEDFTYTTCEVCKGPILMHKEANAKNCQQNEVDKVQFTEEEVERIRVLKYYTSVGTLLNVVNRAQMLTIRHDNCCKNCMLMFQTRLDLRVHCTEVHPKEPWTSFVEEPGQKNKRNEDKQSDRNYMSILSKQNDNITRLTDILENQAGNT